MSTAPPSVTSSPVWCSQAVYEGEGWLSIGFSDPDPVSMPGSDSVVGLPGVDTVLEYDMEGYSQPDEASLQARGGERVGHIYVSISIVCRVTSQQLVTSQL